MTKGEKALQAWICTFCGSPHETEEQAEHCWESHIDLRIEYIYGGIGSKSDMPSECIIKKHERGYVTEIATYERTSLKKVKFRERKSIGKKE